MAATATTQTREREMSLLGLQARTGAVERQFCGNRDGANVVRNCGGTVVDDSCGTHCGEDDTTNYYCSDGHEIQSSDSNTDLQSAAASPIAASSMYCSCDDEEEKVEASVANVLDRQNIHLRDDDESYVSATTAVPLLPLSPGSGRLPSSVGIELDRPTVVRRQSSEPSWLTAAREVQTAGPLLLDHHSKSSRSSSSMGSRRSGRCSTLPAAVGEAAVTRTSSPALSLGNAVKLAASLKNQRHNLSGGAPGAQGKSCGRSPSVPSVVTRFPHASSNCLPRTSRFSSFLAVTKQPPPESLSAKPLPDGGSRKEKRLPWPQLSNIGESLRGSEVQLHPDPKRPTTSTHLRRTPRPHTANITSPVCQGATQATKPFSRGVVYAISGATTASRCRADLPDLQQPKRSAGQDLELSGLTKGANCDYKRETKNNPPRCQSARATGLVKRQSKRLDRRVQGINCPTSQYATRDSLWNQSGSRICRQMGSSDNIVPSHNFQDTLPLPLDLQAQRREANGPATPKASAPLSIVTHHEGNTPLSGGEIVVALEIESGSCPPDQATKSYESQQIEDISMQPSKVASTGCTVKSSTTTRIPLTGTARRRAAIGGNPSSDEITSSVPGLRERRPRQTQRQAVPCVKEAALSKQNVTKMPPMVHKCSDRNRHAVVAPSTSSSAARSVRSPGRGNGEKRAQRPLTPAKPSCHDPSLDEARRRVPTRGNTKGWRLNLLMRKVAFHRQAQDLLSRAAPLTKAVVPTLDSTAHPRCTSDDATEKLSCAASSTNIRRDNSQEMPTAAGDLSPITGSAPGDLSSTAPRRRRSSIPNWIMTPRHLEMLATLHTGATPRSSISSVDCSAQLDAGLGAPRSNERATLTVSRNDTDADHEMNDSDHGDNRANESRQSDEEGSSSSYSSDEDDTNDYELDGCTTASQELGRSKSTEGSANNNNPCVARIFARVKEAQGDDGGDVCGTKRNPQETSHDPELLPSASEILPRLLLQRRRRNRRAPMPATCLPGTSFAQRYAPDVIDNSIAIVANRSLQCQRLIDRHRKRAAHSRSTENISRPGTINRAAGRAPARARSHLVSPRLGATSDDFPDLKSRNLLSSHSEFTEPDLQNLAATVELRDALQEQDEQAKQSSMQEHLDSLLWLALNTESKEEKHLALEEIACHCNSTKHPPWNWVGYETFDSLLVATTDSAAVKIHPKESPHTIRPPWDYRHLSTESRRVAPKS